MIVRWLAPILLGLLLLGGAATASISPAELTHYVPQVGDEFHYYEDWQLNSGTGNYSGYYENEYTNGSIQVTATASDGTEAASYSNTNTWDNVTGSIYAWTSSGTFTFSASSFLYVDGTDNQTGYTNPYVWFYVNNTLPVGGSLELLNTPSTVLSTDYSFPTALSPTGYATTIWTKGTGSFQRDDIYGDFAANYTWFSYFDPSTGYIVGYLYLEHDVDSAGNGFEIVDSLGVTSTTYPLTAASSASSGSSSSGLSETEVVAIVVVVVVIVVVVIAVIVSRSRRSRLPKHSAGGAMGFGPPPRPPPIAAPPPVQLTPSGQPAVQQIVIRETVKAPCRYCGTLMDSTATVCPSCGAPRT